MGIVIRGGQVFDGSGGARRAGDVLVGDDGVVEAIGPALDVPEGTDEVDARGCWVTPGFIDLHTHYDAELEVAPALDESVRHGVTTVLVGSCGLSMAVGEPEDLADMFCRVEGIPRDQVLPILRDVVDWDEPAGYLDHLDTVPLGPNVVSMVGHSTIRAHVMGLGRSLDHDVHPGADEQAELERLTADAVEAGYLGISINLLPWDKMGGTRFRSRSTPSVYARFAEYRRLGEVIRRQGALFQAIPDLQSRWSIFPLIDMSRPRPRKGGAPLRTSLLTLMDAPPAMGAYKVMAGLADRYNRHLGADVRFQALPTPFDLYTDGIENPVFEEIGAGTEALHLEDLASRRALMQAPPYRERFRKQWTSKLSPRAYHRDLREARIISCPDHSLDGRTFGEVADARGVDPLDAFLDLQVQYGNDLRWFTVVANAREDRLRWIVSHPAAIIGFSDAGAHLRNMAFYNFPLRMLKRVRDAEAAGEGFMTVERAVHRLTGEIGDFLQVDAGHLEVGRRADVVVVDPEGLDDAVEEVHEAPMADFDGLRRLVRRNDDAVRAVLVNGKVAWHGTKPDPDLGQVSGYGTLLRRDPTIG